MRLALIGCLLMGWVVLAACEGCRPAPAPAVEAPSSIADAVRVQTTARDASESALVPAAEVDGGVKATPPSGEPVPDDPQPTLATQTPTPVATLTRENGRMIVSTESKAEEILAVPRGVMWAESSHAVWRAVRGDTEPQVVSRLVDPHGLATDGRRVVWLGYEKNEQIRIADGEITPLPPIGLRAQQETLAFGGALYGRTYHPVQLVQIGRGVTILPFKPDPSWSVSRGLGAGNRKLFVPALRREPDGSVVSFFIRFDPAGAMTTLPTDKPAAAGTWSVNAAGDLAFLSDELGTVSFWPAGAKTARMAFVDTTVEQLCWCDRDICSLGGGAIRRHPKRGGPILLAEDAGHALRMSCGFGQIAWSADVSEGTSRITVIGSSPPPPPRSHR
jgi:hypothetical protein